MGFLLAFALPKYHGPLAAVAKSVGLSAVALLGLLALTIAASYIRSAQFNRLGGDLRCQHRADSLILHACPPHQAAALGFRRGWILLAWYYVCSSIQRFPDQGLEVSVIMYIYFISSKDIDPCIICETVH